MKGYVSHLITENEKLEQELMADYDAAHAEGRYRRTERLHS